MAQYTRGKTNSPKHCRSIAKEKESHARRVGESSWRNETDDYRN